MTLREPAIRYLKPFAGAARPCADYGFGDGAHLVGKCDTIIIYMIGDSYNEKKKIFTVILMLAIALDLAACSPKIESRLL